MIPFSVLDLVPILEGGSTAEALASSLRLARHAEVAGDVRRAHDAADDIGHDHRLRPADVGPTTIVEPRLKAFVEPAEALEQSDDKLIGAHATLTIYPCCRRAPTGSR